MKKVLNGVIISLSLFVLIGCTNTNNTLNNIVNSDIVKNLTKTDREIVEDKFEEFLNKEIDLIQSNFNQRFPYSRDDLIIPYSKNRYYVVNAQS